MLNVIFLADPFIQFAFRITNCCRKKTLICARERRTFICGIVFINLQCLFFHNVWPQCVRCSLFQKLSHDVNYAQPHSKCNIAFFPSLSLSIFIFSLRWLMNNNKRNARAHMHPNAYCTHVHVAFRGKKCDQSKVTYWNDRPKIDLGVPKKVHNDKWYEHTYCLWHLHFAACPCSSFIACLARSFPT